MIERAIKRRHDVLDRVLFLVCDATDQQALLALRRSTPFTNAVADMAIMDIADITPLMRAVHTLLAPGGIFVFATHHPCFTYPNDDYFTSCIDKGIAIEGQPLLQNYYHRSINPIFATALDAGFVIDGFHEDPFPSEKAPIIMTILPRKGQ